MSKKKHNEDIEKELKSMQHTLQAWSDACGGDDNPDCPILKGLGNF